MAIIDTKRKNVTGGKITVKTISERKMGNNPIHHDNDWPITVITYQVEAHDDNGGFVSEETASSVADLEKAVARAEKNISNSLSKPAKPAAEDLLKNLGFQ